MPSWNDGEISGESCLGDYESDVSYAPDWIFDPAFTGVTDDAPELCHGHKRPPSKFVAFEGTNTGRRFYSCSVDCAISNCGFVSWADPDWPETMKNALQQLLSMYNESNSTRIDEKIQNGKLIKELSEEKNKVAKKYNSLIDDVKKWMDNTERQVMEQNYAKFKADCDDQKLAPSELAEKELQMRGLKDELFKLQQVYKAEKELIDFREKKCHDEREALKVQSEALKVEMETVKLQGDALRVEKEALKKEKEAMKADCTKALDKEADCTKALKEDKKKLEYMLFDLLKASDGQKEKL